MKTDGPPFRPLLQSLPEGETTLTNLSGIVKQLKKERDRVQQQLSGLNAALAAFAGVYRDKMEPISPQDVSTRPCPHCSSSESTLGESQGT